MQAPKTFRQRHSSAQDAVQGLRGVQGVHRQGVVPRGLWHLSSGKWQMALGRHGVLAPRGVVRAAAHLEARAIALLPMGATAGRQPILAPLLQRLAHPVGGARPVGEGAGPGASVYAEDLWRLLGCG